MNIKVGVLRIGGVNFVSVNGEVWSEIAHAAETGVALSPAP